MMNIPTCLNCGTTDKVFWYEWNHLRWQWPFYWRQSIMISEDYISGDCFQMREFFIIIDLNPTRRLESYEISLYYCIWYFVPPVNKGKRYSCDCHHTHRARQMSFCVSHSKTQSDTQIYKCTNVISVQNVQISKCIKIQIYKYIAGPSGDCADRRLSALYIQNTRKLSADWKCRKLWDWKNKQKTYSIWL